MGVSRSTTLTGYESIKPKKLNVGQIEAPCFDPHSSRHQEETTKTQPAEVPLQLVMMQHGSFPSSTLGQLLVRLLCTAVSVQFSYNNQRAPDQHPSPPDPVTHKGLRKLPQHFQRSVCCPSYITTPNIHCWH